MKVKPATSYSSSSTDSRTANTNKSSSSTDGLATGVIVGMIVQSALDSDKAHASTSNTTTVAVAPKPVVPPAPPVWKFKFINDCDKWICDN